MLKAKEIMSTSVISAKRTTEIYDVIKLLIENNITGVPVVNDNMTLVGIITEKDVLELLYNFEDKAQAVENYMAKDVISFDHEDDLVKICDSFLANNFRRVPILAEGKVVGIISRKDIIGYISKRRQKDKVGKQKSSKAVASR